MIAAVLHLHESAGVPVEAVDQMERGIAHRRQIVDDDFLPGGDAEIEGALHIDPGRRRVLRHIAEHAIDLGHHGESRGLGLRRAAGDDDLGVRPLPLQAADGLARLAHGLGGHGAGIDDDRIREPGRLRVAAYQLRLGGIQPATEGDDFDDIVFLPISFMAPGEIRPPPHPRNASLVLGISLPSPPPE